MELALVYLYAIFNISVLLFHIRKYGLSLNPGFLVLSFYVLIACMAVPAYTLLPQDAFFRLYNFKNITIIPYVIYFLAMYMMLKPTLGFHKVIATHSVLCSPLKLRLFSYAYIISATVAVLLMYKAIMSQSVLDNLAQVRVDMYEGESIQIYDNVFEHIFVTFTAFFQVPATLFFFLILTEKRYRMNVFVMLSFAVMLVLPTFLDAVRTASRGMVVSLFFRLLLCYGMFSSKMPKKIKRIFFFSGIALVLLILLYLLLVTTARFGEGDSGISSLICYWGQPTLVFNSQVMDIDVFANGRIFFMPIYDAMGIDSTKIFVQVTKEFGSCFTTLLGTAYMDFGIFGIAFLALVVPAIVNKIIYKSSVFDLSRLYIILFYSLLLQNGALTIQWGYISNIGYCIFFYFVLKFMSPKRKRVKQVA